MTYPYIGINGAYYGKAFLDAAWKHLLANAPLWQAGIAEPSPADRLAYAVLKQVSRVTPHYTAPDAKDCT